MPIVKNSQSNVVVPLFTVSNGVTSWWALRLFVELVAGQAATVALKVNGQDVPNFEGALTAQVDSGSRPTRTAADFVRLEDGDIVSADVQGPGTVNLSLSGDVASEQL